VKRFPLILLLAFLAFHSGCIHTSGDLGADRQNVEWEEDGWPFRWKITPLNGGTRMTRVLIDLPSGPTRADKEMKADILNEIGNSWWHQNIYPAKLEDVRIMPDGREVWILEEPRKTGGRAHVISFKPEAKSGKQFTISGMIAFDKGTNPVTK
jgi:hypothetical protein